MRTGAGEAELLGADMKLACLCAARSSVQGCLREGAARGLSCLLLLPLRRPEEQRPQLAGSKREASPRSGEGSGAGKEPICREISLTFPSAAAVAGPGASAPSDGPPALKRLRTTAGAALAAATPPGGSGSGGAFRPIACQAQRAPASRTAFTGRPLHLVPPQLVLAPERLAPSAVPLVMAQPVASGASEQQLQQQQAQGLLALPPPPTPAAAPARNHDVADASQPQAGTVGAGQQSAAAGAAEQQQKTGAEAAAMPLPAPAQQGVQLPLNLAAAVLASRLAATMRSGPAATGAARPPGLVPSPPTALALPGQPVAVGAGYGGAPVGVPGSVPPRPGAGASRASSGAAPPPPLFSLPPLAASPAPVQSAGAAAAAAQAQQPPPQQPSQAAGSQGRQAEVAPPPAAGFQEESRAKMAWWMHLVALQLDPLLELAAAGQHPPLAAPSAAEAPLASGAGGSEGGAAAPALSASARFQARVALARKDGTLRGLYEAMLCR